MSDEAGVGPVLRRLSVAEAEEVLVVLLAAFPRWPAFEIAVPAIDHLRWKMEPPGQPNDLHSACEVDGCMLGVQLRWMGRVELRGREHALDGGIDLAVHRDSRGQGLGSLLRDGGAERTFGTGSIRIDTIPANPLSRQMYEARVPVSRLLDFWVRPLNARAALVVGARALPGRLEHRARQVLGAGSSAVDQPVEMVDQFGARAAALWERVRTGYELARTRDTEWLNWRYCNPRPA